MDELKFKTNIKCSGCISQVAPHLDNTVGDSNWKVDLQNPDKILIISANDVMKDSIVEAVEKAGFRIDEIIE